MFFTSLGMFWLRRVVCAVGGRVRPLDMSVKTIENLTNANDYSFAMARVA